MKWIKCLENQCSRASRESWLKRLKDVIFWRRMLDDDVWGNEFTESGMSQWVWECMTTVCLWERHQPGEKCASVRREREERWMNRVKNFASGHRCVVAQYKQRNTRVSVWQKFQQTHFDQGVKIFSWMASHVNVWHCAAASLPGRNEEILGSLNLHMKDF